MVNVGNKFPPARAIEAFIVAAESDSFDIAAQKLNRSKSTFSQQIKLMERHLNCQLLVRGKNYSCQLTEEGLAYYERARQALKLLAPGLPVVPTPTITDYPDFQAVLAESDPNLEDFWHRSEAAGFDFSEDRNPDRRYLRDRAVIFTEKDGVWRYNHIGRLSLFAEVQGFDFIRKLIGREAARCSFSGAYSAYDYEVSKIYNKVQATRKPSLNDVEAYIRLPEDRYDYVCYRRLVIPGVINDVPGVVVQSAALDEMPMLKMSNTRIIPLDTGLKSRISVDFTTLVRAWKEGRGLWESEQIKPFHDRLFLVTPLPGPVGSLKMEHIGGNHGSVSLFGQQWRKLSVDEMFSDDDLGNDYNRKMEDGYRDVLTSGSYRLDMIRTTGALPNGAAENLVYFRLLLRCILPDGGFGVANMIHRARHLEEAPGPDTCLELLLRSADL